MTPLWDTAHHRWCNKDLHKKPFRGNFLFSLTKTIFRILRAFYIDFIVENHEFKSVGEICNCKGGAGSILRWKNVLFSRPFMPSLNQIWQVILDMDFLCPCDQWKKNNIEKRSQNNNTSILTCKLPLKWQDMLLGAFCCSTENMAWAHCLSFMSFTWFIFIATKNQTQKLTSGQNFHLKQPPKTQSVTV